MSGIRVTHGIGDLANDLTAIRKRVRPEMREVVRDGIRAGNELAVQSAKRQEGTHGKYYHRAFSAEMSRGLGLFGNTISGEYGPVVTRKQGGMAFEDGPGPQTRPHNNLRKSLDIIGPQFEREVDAVVGSWFW